MMHTGPFEIYEKDPVKRQKIVCYKCILFLTLICSLFRVFA